MSIETLKEEVLAANLDLVTKNLVISTWGNVSGYDGETGVMVIKASGVPYDKMTKEHMVTVDLDGNVLDSPYSPSTDTWTHIELYRAWKDKGIRGIVHTHSLNATMWAQLGQDIPVYGTTHCDYFNGDIPCTRLMTGEEIGTDYERNTGKVILERMEALDPDERCAGPQPWAVCMGDFTFRGCLKQPGIRLCGKYGLYELHDDRRTVRQGAEGTFRDSSEQKIWSWRILWPEKPLKNAGDAI